MTNEAQPEAGPITALEAYRMNLAALEAERNRLLAKYDARIAALRQAIGELERQLPEAAPAPRRTRKGTRKRASGERSP